MVKHFNMKHLAVAICIATCIPASPVQAAWGEQLMQKATDFMQKQATSCLPYLKKPETYAIAAAAAIGTYFMGREIYWGLKTELPAHRVPVYVRSSIASRVSNSEAQNELQELILSQLEVPEQGSAQIKKQWLETLIRKHTYNYEFDPLRTTIPRVHDWETDGIQVIDHSNFVCSQTGSNCGYHTAFNAMHLYRLFVSKNAQKVFDLHCDALKAGPPIADWKRFVANQFTDTNYNASCENINDAVIHRLMIAQLMMHPENFTMIANPSQDPALVDEDLPKVIAALQNRSKKAHAFLLGNMRDTGYVGGSGGHWIAAVVTTEGGLKVHVADSISGRLEGRRSTVNQLIGLLRQNTEWAAMKGDIESRLETAKTVLNDNGNFVGCHKKLGEVFDRMKVASVQAQQEFRKEYGGFMHGLLERLSAGKSGVVESIVAENKQQSGIKIRPKTILKSLDHSLNEMYLFLAGPDTTGGAGPSSSSVGNGLLYKRPSTLASSIQSRLMN